MESIETMHKKRKEQLAQQRGVSPRKAPPQTRYSSSSSGASSTSSPSFSVRAIAGGSGDATGGIGENAVPTWSPRYGVDAAAQYHAEQDDKARSSRGLTLRDMMSVTVPSQNTAHFRMQSMHLETGAGFGKSAPQSARDDISRPVTKTNYFDETYMPPGMSPPKSLANRRRTAPSTSSTSASQSSSSGNGSGALSLSEIKRLALKDHLAKNSKTKTRGPRVGGKSGSSNRRSYREGGNHRGAGSRFQESQRRLERRGNAGKGSPAIKRSHGDASEEGRKNKSLSTRYCYPNERRLHNLDSNYNIEVPLVPPSRRKFAAMKEERGQMAAHGGSTSKLAAVRSKDKGLQKKAQLKVAKILADVARGRAPDGSYGPAKPPSRLWPTNSYNAKSPKRQ